MLREERNGAPRGIRRRFPKHMQLHFSEHPPACSAENLRIASIASSNAGRNAATVSVFDPSAETRSGCFRSNCARVPDTVANCPVGKIKFESIHASDSRMYFA